MFVRQFALSVLLICLCGGATLAQTERLTPEVNSLYIEKKPLFNADGSSLYFVREGDPQNVGDADADDIWRVSLQPNGFFTEAINIGAPLNNREANALIGINANQNVVYLQGIYDETGEKGLFVSRRAGGRLWSLPHPLRIIDFDISTIHQAFVSSDEQILLFTAVAPNQLHDIFIAYRGENDVFQKPAPLPKTVNTLDEEWSATFAADGLTLFFIAERNGVIQIFTAQRQPNDPNIWSEPRHVPTDAALTLTRATVCAASPDGEWLYFNALANAADSTTSDLYRVRLSLEMRPKPTVLLNVLVTDAAGGQNVGSSAQIIVRTFADGSTRQTTLTNSGNTNITIGANEKSLLFAQSNDNLTLLSNSLCLRCLDDQQADEDSIATNGQSALLPSNALNMEVERCQLRLRTLDSTVQALEIERAKNEIIVKKMKPQTAQPNVVASDKTLNLLRQQYEQYRLEQYRDPAPEAQGKTAKAVRDATNETELARLRNTFRKIETIDTTTESGKVMLGDPKPAPPPSESSNKTDLERLRDKYNQYTGRMPTTPALTPAPPPEVAAPVAVADPDFERYRDLIQIEVMKEMYADMRKALQANLLEDVRREMEPTLDNENRRLLQLAYREKVQQLEKNEILISTETPLAQDLKKIMREELKQTLQQDMKEIVKREIRTELQYLVAVAQRKKCQNELSEKIRAQATAWKETSKTPSSNNLNLPLPTSNTNSTTANGFQILELNLQLATPTLGQKWTLQGVQFEKNKVELLPTAFYDLDRVAKWLTQNPNVNIEISVHTNAFCSRDFAQTLTDQRAKAIGEYFAGRGISLRRLRTLGVGNAQPLSSNATTEGRLRNQRVEILVVQ